MKECLLLNVIFVGFSEITQEMGETVAKIVACPACRKQYKHSNMGICLFLGERNL